MAVLVCGNSATAGQQGVARMHIGKAMGLNPTVALCV